MASLCRVTRELVTDLPVQLAASGFLADALHVRPGEIIGAGELPERFGAPVVRADPAVTVWMVASRWPARAGLWARMRAKAALMARVMFTRARSAADPALRSWPPRPTAAASWPVRNCISWRAWAARTGSAHEVASARSSSRSRSRAR